MFGLPSTDKLQSTNSIRTLIIGGFLMYFAIFVVVTQLFVMGYLVRVLRYVLEDEEYPPVFDKWGELLIDGVKAYTIWIVYLLLPIALLLSTQQDSVTNEIVLIILGLFFGGIIGGLLSFTTDRTAVSVVEQFESSLLSEFITLLENLGIIEVFSLTLPFVLALYVAPAALTNFVRNESFRAGFDIKTFAPILLSRWYFVGWLVFLLSWTISTFILSSRILYNFNYIREVFTDYGLSTFGFVLAETVLTISTFVSFYLLIVAYYIIGRSWIYASLSTKTPLDYIRDALNRETASTIFIGGFLISTGTIIASAFIMGYIVRLLQCTDEAGSPDFENWLQLFSDGIKSLIILVSYAILPLLMISSRSEIYHTYRYSRDLPVNVSAELLAAHITTTISFTRLLSLSIGINIFNELSTLIVDIMMLTNSRPSPMLGGSAGLFLILLLSVIISYVYPAALMNFATKNTLRAGFEIRYLFSIIQKREYIVAWCKIFSIWLLIGVLHIGRSLWMHSRIRPQYEFLPQFEGQRPTDHILLNEFLPSTYTGLIDQIPVITVGTSFGLVHGSTLLILSIVNFYILVKTYTYMREKWNTLSSRT